MSEKTVIGAVHRHDGVYGLVLRVGQTPPRHYQRHLSVTVTSIIVGTERDPVKCLLSDGDTIYIAPEAVNEFIFA